MLVMNRQEYTTFQRTSCAPQNERPSEHLKHDAADQQLHNCCPLKQLPRARLENQDRPTRALRLRRQTWSFRIFRRAVAVILTGGSLTRSLFRGVYLWLFICALLRIDGHRLLLLPRCRRLPVRSRRLPLLTASCVRVACRGALA